jgi:Meckel syndrome type 1 protein
MISGKEQFERDFEAFLKEDDSQLAALYRKLPQVEPDARVDAAVLAMAHRALNPALVATPLPTAARRRARWLPALGAAAGIVLAAGVALRVGPQIWSDRSDHAAGAPADQLKDSVIQVRPLDAPATPPPPASPAPPPAPMAAAPAAAKAAGELRALKPADAEREPAAKTVRQEAATSAPALAADRNAMDTKELNKVENVAPQPGAAHAFPGRARSQTEMDAVERKQAIAAGAWQTLPENTPKNAAPDASPDAARNAAESGAAAPAATATVSSGFATQREKKAEPAGTAEVLIEHIRREIREHHREAAMRNLADFRRRYPDYMLPQDLRDLK